MMFVSISAYLALNYSCYDLLNENKSSSFVRFTQCDKIKKKKDIVRFSYL